MNQDEIDHSVLCFYVFHEKLMHTYLTSGKSFLDVLQDNVPKLQDQNNGNYVLTCRSCLKVCNESPKNILSCIVKKEKQGAVAKRIIDPYLRKLLNIREEGGIFKC